MLAATSASVQGEGRVRVDPSGKETLTCELKGQTSGRTKAQLETEMFMTGSFHAQPNHRSVASGGGTSK
ncbi:hypothetical protein EBR21_13245 [bacterium]|nr:hypothetical protein [bacterium]